MGLQDQYVFCVPEVQISTHWLISVKLDVSIMLQAVTLTHYSLTS
jgi:hypothetical protein